LKLSQKLDYYHTARLNYEYAHAGSSFFFCFCMATGVLPVLTQQPRRPVLVHGERRISPSTPSKNSKGMTRSENRVPPGLRYKSKNTTRAEAELHTRGTNNRIANVTTANCSLPTGSKHKPGVASVK